MARVTIENIYKQFGDILVVKDVSLVVEDGEFVVLVGPSGCGKTTTLRMIAGLEDISQGQILIDNIVVNDVHPRDRDVAMVFQSYALYPHMTVWENLAYALKMRRLSKPEIRTRVNEAAAMLQIGELLSRKPAQLSGGQRQRVALGRAIVRRPAVFLMDEPLSNLDAKLRVQMRGELMRLHRQLGVTTIYVTHDQVEAMTMGNRIAVMHQGVVQQMGAPLDLYHHPHNLFVASFIGSPQMNQITGQLENDGRLTYFDSPAMRVALSPLPINQIVPDLSDTSHGQIILGIRPEHFQTGIDGAPRETLDIGAAQIDYVEQLGRETYAGVTVKGLALMVELNPSSSYRPGDVIHLGVGRANLLLFDQHTGLTLRTLWTA